MKTTNANGCLHYAELLLNKVPTADLKEQLAITRAAYELVQIARTFIGVETGPELLSWEASETLARYCPEFATTRNGDPRSR